MVGAVPILFANCHLVFGWGESLMATSHWKDARGPVPIARLGRNTVRRADIFGGAGLLVLGLLVLFVIIPAEADGDTWSGVSPWRRWGSDWKAGMASGSPGLANGVWPELPRGSLARRM